MTDTTKLAERIEALEGPCRETDAEIYSALFPEKVPSPIVQSGYGWRFDGQGWWCETGEDARAPRNSIYPPDYTASLDAAMTLVPEGLRWCVDDIGKPQGVHSFIEDIADFSDDAACYKANASTPALALCAAALRAQEAHNG